MSEEGVQPKHWLFKAADWVCGLTLLMFGGFSAGWIGMFALADLELLMRFPGLARHGLTVFFGTTMGLLILRRRMKVAIVFLVACTVGSLVLVEAGRRQGVLGNRQDVTDDIVVKTYQLRAKLEAAHAAKVDARGWTDLLNAELIDAPSDFDTRYYSNESFMWRSEFDSAGKFVGSIHVRGDKARNVPSYSVDFKDRKLSKAQLGEYNELLPCFPRE